MVTGWQAAREIEGLISDPGDSVFHYGLPYPPTVEDYIELLRTDWADRIFVLAGGTDPGGSLFPYAPLDLDTWSPLQPCPPMVSMTSGFLLIRDHYPLGALPGGCCGDETIPWPDTRSYPFGYPIDGCAYYEEEYALWDITGYVDNICEENDFSMRVCVTDHVGNWQRSGFIEDMQVGVPSIDNTEVDVVSLHCIDETKTYSWVFNGPAPETIPPGQKGIASTIHLRDDEGKIYLYYVAKVIALNNDPPQGIYAYAKSTESPAPGPSIKTTNPLQLSMIDPSNPINQQIIDELIELLGDLPLCGYFYVGTLTVQDTPNLGLEDTIFISSRDDACWNGDCNDHTFIAANNGQVSDTGGFFVMEGYHTNLTYGKRRGSGRETPNPSSNEYELAWLNYERMIKTGGFEMVTVELDDHSIDSPVQAQADLICINAHGVSLQGLGDLPVLSSFTDQGQVEAGFEYLVFSAHSGFGIPPVYQYDLTGEIWCKYPLFKKQVYSPQYDEPSWLILLSCHQLSMDGGIDSARWFWHETLYDSGTSHRFFDCIGGYKEAVSVSTDWYSEYNYDYFLKYCAGDFSTMLENGAPYDPDYYYDDIGPFFEDKRRWLIDAWLASHLKELEDCFTAKGFREVCLIAGAMDKDFYFYIKGKHRPGSIHIPLLHAKKYYIFDTTWDGTQL